MHGANATGFEKVANYMPILFVNLQKPRSSLLARRAEFDGY
jgi:hypothetical protein